MRLTEEELRGWRAGDLATCASLAARAGPKSTPDFAVRAIAICEGSSEGSWPSVTAIRRAAEDRNAWRSMHDHFDACRLALLDLERRGAPASVVALHYAAENVARVLYDATAPADPFDDDSAAWLLRTLADVDAAMTSRTGDDVMWSQLVAAWQAGDER